MKIIKCIMVTLLTTLLLLGCGSKSNVDTAPLEKSFASAEPANKTAADKAVAAIKTEDYSGAMTQLRTLASQVKLTPEQQQAVKDVLAQVQKQLADSAAKLSKDGQKAAT